MKNYQWVLFDVDETLFHFDSFSGLKLALTRLGFELSKHDFDAYEKINKSLWVDYQNCKITSQQLQYERFKSWAGKLQIPANHLIEAFQTAMAEITKPLDGAIALLNALKGKTKMGIITNGFTQMQQARLERAGLKNHFDVVVISEQVGIPKPQPGIFEHALNQMDNPLRDQVLMVGDNPECDVQGALNAGLNACWLNAHNRPLAKEITPHYQVKSLGELHQLLFAEAE